MRSIHPEDRRALEAESRRLVAEQTRREFMARSGSGLGGLWLMRFAPLIAAAQACADEAASDGAAFTTFTAREGADFEAFSARIVPTDDTPGAREAGSVYFADQALGGFMEWALPMVRGGLGALHERVAETFSDAGAFADLAEAQQDELIGAIEQEDPGFFFFAKTLVMLGMSTDPRYGGNRGGVGWDLIGFERTYAYAPPFGYYDRDEHGESTASAEETPASARAAAAGPPHVEHGGDR